MKDNLNLLNAIEEEKKAFEDHYTWLSKNMSSSFSHEVKGELISLIARNLIDFESRQCFTSIYFKRFSIILCLDEVTSDIEILKNFKNKGIKNYFFYISRKPFKNFNKSLKVVFIYFTEAIETVETPFSERKKNEFKQLLDKHEFFEDSEFDSLIKSINTHFLNSLSSELLVKAFTMFSRAKLRDTCQYEVIFNEDYKEKNIPSLQIILAWKNAPKYDFLNQIAHMIFFRKLKLSRVNATYINPYEKDTILIMALGIDSYEDKAAWEVADINDFLKELATAKYFTYFDSIFNNYVKTKLIDGNQANLLRTIVAFVHQCLILSDYHLYSLENCQEAILRHPELTLMLLDIFKFKFDPTKVNLDHFLSSKRTFIDLVDKIDTGSEINDIRRKNVLKTAINFIEHTYKTNFYQNNKTAHAFRLDPQFIKQIPANLEHRFPITPWGIFFITNSFITSFHIRFKDLSRGGVRTIIPQTHERYHVELGQVFTECYNLALTQQKKNKDIPEGGSKAVILLRPFEIGNLDISVLKNELEISGIAVEIIEKKLKALEEEKKLQYLYDCQRSFIRNLLTLVNCDENFSLKAKNIIDYLKEPEYLYLGPDENMHDCMIEWIAEYSKQQDYRPKTALISGKPGLGINHKEYGVTSLGVNIYMEEVLKYLNIDPKKQTFTVKISGGPDGDVAGNQINNLYQFYKNTAKVVAITDVSGTIFDPSGLDLEALHYLFKHAEPVCFYPLSRLSEGGFLLNLKAKKQMDAYSELTLLTRSTQEGLIEDWLNGSEMNVLYRTNILTTKADIFIPAGGRPKTIHEGNYKDLFDITGHINTKAIVEGANLYLTNKARQLLEEAGMLIIKDSSANKTGVICSSFEVLCDLTLSEKFLEVKPQLVNEILEILKEKARNEAQLLLTTHQLREQKLSEISDLISDNINTLFDEIFNEIKILDLCDTSNTPIRNILYKYLPPLIRSKYLKDFEEKVPDNHKKAIIACYLSSNIIYKEGLFWKPSLKEILPHIIEKFN
jgi:glutamate dehydrogenase